jgi:cytochrome c biogenesis protein CcmG/thiol:disulfide interchange protein DsbE
VRGLFAALAAAVLLAGCATTTPQFRDSGFAACPAPSAATALPGKALPATALPAAELECMDGSGTRMPLDRPVGVPMVVNLWAPWCGPCAEELPAFQRLYADAGDALVVLGVVTKSDPGQTVSAARDLGLRFPNVFDRDEEVLRGLRQRGLPVTVFVGPDGGVRSVYKGGVLTDAALRGLVRTHLGVDVR